MSKLTPIAAVLLAGGAFALHAQQAVPSPTAPSGQQAQARVRANVPAADRRFMARAAESGHAEVAAGRLAISHATDPAVRDYGRMLVDDHQRADTRLVAIAHARGIVLPTGPSAGQRRRLQELARLQPQAFEREFLQQMIVDHRLAVDLFQQEANREGAPVALRNYAGQVLPTLQQHLRRAESMHASVQAAPGATASAAASTSYQQALRAPNGMSAELADAREQVHEAVQAVQRMKSDPQVARLLERAQGVFIVPSYARGALGIGAQGGKAVLVTRKGQEFGSPAFYNMAGISIGAQAGAAGGEVAFLLMTDRAVQKFRSDRNFSLNVDAGLTFASYSSRGHASTGKVQDVIVWSGTEGAYAGLSVGVTDILADNDANRAYYGRADATPLAILGGRLEDPYGNALGRVLGA